MISSRGDIIATGGDDTIIKIWDLSINENEVSVKKFIEIDSHADRILHLDISVDDSLVN